MAIEILRRRPVAELQPSKGAVRLIAAFEGLSLKAYRDSVGILTAGYGHTGPEVTEGMQITLKQADDWLAEDIGEAADILRKSVAVYLTQGEFDALTSITFNIGRVPRSMLAALNGGSSDKGEVYAPGSYGSALKQFPRNCRAGGIPLRGLYRRRLAEACTFSDMPWENACSQTVVQLEVDSAKNIVPSGTTSLEDTLMRARQDVPIMRPDVSDTMRSPWPTATTVIVDAIPDGLGGIPVQLPIPDQIEEDELLLDTPAATALEPDAKGTAQGQPPSPAPARVPSPDLVRTSPEVEKPNPAPQASPPVLPKSAPVGGPSVAAVEARPVPVAPPPLPPMFPPPPPKLPDPPIPVGQQTRAVDAARKSEDWSHSAKSMIFSRRFWGLFLVVVGRLWMLKTGSNAVLGTVSDPIVTEMFSGFMVMILGEIVQRVGERRATRPLK